MVECFTGISKSTKQLSDLATIGILSIEVDKVTIDVEAHLVPHPTKLKPSMPEPTPSSEDTGNREVAKSQHAPEGDEVAIEFAGRLQQNKTSSYESLGASKITAHGAEAIARALSTNTSLQTLGLGDNLLSSQGAAALAGALRNNRTLKVLHLARNDIGDEGVKHLTAAMQHNSTLECLNLSHNHISSEGAAALAVVLRTNKSLDVLLLSSNHIGNVGVKVLSEALRVNTTLKTLRLSSINVGVGGIRLLAEVLCTNDSLGTLDLSGNVTGDDAVECLCRALRANKSLRDLSISVKTATDSAAGMLVTALQANTSLRRLSIWDSNAISDSVKDRMREVAKEKGVHLIVERCDDEPTTTLQGLSPRYQPFLEEKELATHPTALKAFTLTPTPSSEGADSGGVGDPTLPKKELDPAVGRLLQEQKHAQAMKLKPHSVGGPFEDTLLPGMSGEEELFLQQLALRKEKLPQFTHPSSTPAVEKPVRSKLWSTGSSLEGGTDDPIQTRDYLPTSGDREAMSLAGKMLLNRTDSYESMDSAEGPESSQSSSIELSICTEHDKLAVSTALASSEASHTLEKIGKCVGLTDEEILKIEKDASRVSYPDKVNSIVSEWSLKSGEAATMPNLRNILNGLNDENLQMEIQKAMEAGSVLPESIQDSTCDKGIMVASYVSPNPGLSYHEEPEAPQMRREMQNLETAFATLQSKVYRTLSELNISNEEYAIFFTSLMEGVREEFPLGSGTVANSYSGKSLATIIQGLTTSKVWYFLSFQVLIEAVEVYGDPALKDEVKRYQKKVAVFREETKFVDFLRVWCSRNRAESLPDCEAVVAKLDSKWSGFTLQDVADTEHYLAGEFRLRSLVFRLTNGGAGSVTIMWLVITSAVELIKQRLAQIPNLALGNVQGLWIGRKLMFQAEPYRSLYHGKVQPSDPQKFWSDLARLFLDWIEPFSKAFEKDENGIMRWFIDGKVNASALCIDRHMAKDPKKVALLWEKDDSTHEEVTYQELHDMTCKLANVLKHHKVEKGDRVVIYMPAMPLAVAAMLGCARIGAVHCVVFSSSDANSLNHRIKETNARVVITANRAMRGKKTHDLKDILDEALSMEGGTQVRLVLVADRTPKTPVFMRAGRDFSLDKAMEKQPPVCEVTMMDSEDELFIMYTSGTSSAAKGIVHTHAGYLLYVAATHKYVFDYRPGDIFACVAELGWITGHSYVVYGPLCNGATSVLFEGTPLYPDSVHYWKMVQRLNVTQLYTVPALLKHLKDEGDQHLKDYKRTSLRTLGSVGEPLNDDVRKWAFEVVGENRCTFINTWWQTEIGGIAITVEYTPTDDPGKPAVEMKPFFGVEPVVLDPQPPHGQKFEGTGNLYLAKALPGMGRRVLNGSNEFANIGKGSEGYFTKDMVKYESKPGNGFRVIGRVDDAVRYQGEYLVLPDVEKQLESADVRIHKAVVVEMQAQTGATNTTERDKCVYVGCKSGTSKAEKSEVKENLRKDLEERALAFQYIQNIERMPTTPSGKVCRHTLRDRVFLQHDREVSSKEVDEYIQRQRMPICAR